MTEKFDAAGFRKKVAEVNKILEGQGEAAISSDKSGAYSSTGYTWQYIADAVNEVFDGWRYDVLNINVTDKGKSTYAEAHLQLDIIFDGERVTRGQTVGSSSNINQGDAQKGAITDALKKSLSLFSIGNKAFRGELDPEKNKSAAPPKATAKKPNPGPPAKNARPEDEQKGKLIMEITAANKELDLSKDQRDELKKKYTAGKSLAEASLDQLDKLFSVMLDLQNKAAQN